MIVDVREVLTPRELSVYDFVKGSYPEQLSVMTIFEECWPKIDQSMIGEPISLVRTTIRNLRKKLSPTEDIVAPTRGRSGKGYQFKFQVPQEEYL